MEKHIVNWGKDHEKKFETYKQACNFAYEKAFYFTVTIDNDIYQRPF